MEFAETDSSLSQAAAARGQFVDAHCHCLPGVDDGPAGNVEALNLCRALADDGIRTVIATPHQLGRFYGCNRGAEIREAVQLLNERLKQSGISVTVTAGGDVRVDERICEFLKADEILTLADGGRYLLLELPSEVFIDIGPLLAQLNDVGVEAIISHPERHSVLASQPGILAGWQKYRFGLQVTAASLLGQFGWPAQKAAWRFIETGWFLLVATDAHDTQIRRPVMKRAFEHIRAKLGEQTARLLCIENPTRILKGLDLLTPEQLTAIRTHE